MGRIKPQDLLLQSKKKKVPSGMNVATIITFSLIGLLVMFSLYATYKYRNQRHSYHPETDLNKFTRFEHSVVDKEPKGVDSQHGFAILNTSKGSITLEINKDASAGVVEKFVELCQNGYFKGMPFQHVIKNYVIQGGPNKEPIAAEEWTSKGQANSQLATRPKHEAFMFGTAKDKKERKEFELFITTVPIADLRNKLIVLGRVVKGEDIVQEIEEVDTDEHYQPKTPVTIVDITLKKEI